ncbi:uncharacterized protein LOC119094043 [Pollicipes pollicipes]|uniref:uncharacterized protein LOC119094043 n=1 Tax=Pollicipes pollicipes TaxID=41117 RepID=UPI001885298B|nr:uncharacterized protein LOC119094043 [Pollicipes pollicipes]
MTAMLSLALVGAVPITAQEQEHSRLLPLVQQLLRCELVRSVLRHWTPTPPPDVADAATCVTEQELARASRARRHGPLPDLVTSCQPGSPGGGREPDGGRPVSREQLQLRLDRLQAVRKMAQQPDNWASDVGHSYVAPPVSGEERLSPTSEDMGEHEDQDREDGNEDEAEDEAGGAALREGDAGGRARLMVGRDLAAVADKIDAELPPGPLTQSPASSQDRAAPPVTSLGGSRRLSTAATATVAHALACALGELLKQP